MMYMLVTTTGSKTEKVTINVIWPVMIISFKLYFDDYYITLKPKWSATH